MRGTRERGENGAMRGEIIFLGHNFGQLAYNPRRILPGISVMLARIWNVTLPRFSRDITPRRRWVSMTSFEITPKTAVTEREREDLIKIARDKTSLFIVLFCLEIE